VRSTADCQEQEMFRQTVRTFFEREVAPSFEQWEKQGLPPREFWLRAGELGMLGMRVPEEYGGGGAESFAWNAIPAQEAQRVGVSIGGVRVHVDICLPYFLSYGTEGQRQRWLPELVSGRAIAAIAMSEPEAGSDLKSIRTNAVRDGGHYVLNGQKTFITNGVAADLVIVAAQTNRQAGRDGISLLVVENGMPGFERGRTLQKIGLKGQDLAELSFTDVRVPAANLLGEENMGFAYLMSNLAQERLSIAVNSQAAAVNALNNTVAYVGGRKAFGVPIGSFQNTKFELASCAAEIEAGQALVDKSIAALDSGEFTGADAAKVKLFCTELQGKVVDRCLQLHGGYGYMLEYPIAKAYADARVSRIYGGSSEIMKTIIAKSLGL
jgi:acyl-CoA dehydrogenase